MVCCVLGARIWSGSIAAVLLALVSATSWALFAVLTKAIVGRVDGGVLVLLRTPELYGWALVAVLGTIFQQSSFRASSLTASLPTMTVASRWWRRCWASPCWARRCGADGSQLVVLVAAVAVVVVATIALARGEAATMVATEEAGQAPEQAVGRASCATIGSWFSGPSGRGRQRIGETQLRHRFVN